MKLDGSGPWNDVTGLSNLDALVVKLSDDLAPDHRFEGQPLRDPSDPETGQTNSEGEN